MLQSGVDSISDAKRTLRHEILARRDQLDADSRARCSELIFRKLVQLHSYLVSRQVLAYASMASEFWTRDFLRAAIQTGKKLILPRINQGRRRLELFYVEDIEAQLIPGVWGILEPDPQQCEGAPLTAVEWILVPGVAFDCHGQRLGYGGGYYDRLLPTLPVSAPRIAAAFAAQMVEAVPVAPHDLAMDTVITEEAEYCPRMRRAS